ncbi:MAG TPA: sigma-54 dependent transcriptional regulator [Nitrospinota bacterium]|nr:sigma-54 dependent transcriptional regulator [Nitrospinota bacterium]
MSRILIVDDDKSIRSLLSIMLKREGHHVSSTGKGEEAIGLIRKETFDLVITDIRMPRFDGQRILKEVKAVDSEVPVIMITAFASTESVLDAMREGAYDYISKPFKTDEIKMIVRKVLERKKLEKETRDLKGHLRPDYGPTNIVGKSEKMMQIYKTMGKIADSDVTVLITGESGTGKELVAKAIHYNSNRVGKPFMAINCGAIPTELLESELFGHHKGSFTGAVTDKKGLFEIADGGTLFLDEIGVTPLPLQPKLLRALQEKEFKRVGGTKDIKIDVRIIAATNKNLKKAIKDGSFREDLFYRLNIVSIDIPPLRERKEDIPQLVEFLIQKFTQRTGTQKEISPEAIKLLIKYEWPGNVRELENTIERIVALERDRLITPESLPHFVKEEKEEAKEELEKIKLSEGRINLEKVLADTEKRLLLAAIKEAKGVRKKAAELLGLSFRSMRYRLKKHKTSL